MLPDVFNPVSPQAGAITTLFYVVLGICAVIFLIVVGFLGYNSWRFRHRKADSEVYQNFGNKKLEIIWTVIPFLTVIAIFVLVVRADDKSDRPADRDPDIHIIGHQWWWEVVYPKSGIVTANEIHIPTHRQLLVKLDSADVIHSFWVPRLGRKMDMIPGHTNYLWIDSEEAGEFLGTCAEYCGNQHAWMRIRLTAEPEAQFDAWLDAQKRTPPKPENVSDAALRGFHLFTEKTCSNCHSVDQTPDGGPRAAPNLAHFASRTTLGAGVMLNNPGNLTDWLLEPDRIKPGCNMPNLKLSDHEVSDLVAYLETLK